MGKSRSKEKRLLEIYDLMLRHFGPRHWWPAETVFEIIVGAILTQSVSWKNVTKAIENLKSAGLMSLEALFEAPVEDIEKQIIPTLYWRMKAQKIKAFVNHVMENYQGNLNELLQKPVGELREELLNLYGIGPETADSIILYAANQPVFVVDAYTRRIFHRLGFFNEKVSYDEMQDFFTRHLKPDVSLYNEYHALIVGVGNQFCSNKKPTCEKCPLTIVCNFEKS